MSGLVGITIDDDRFHAGQAYVFAQSSLRELLERVVPAMEDQPHDFYLLRFSVNGWELHAANGGAGDPSTTLNYAVIAKCDDRGRITMAEVS